MVENFTLVHILMDPSLMPSKEESQQLSISRQCEMMGLHRSSYYYQSKPIGPEDLALMRRIYKMNLQNPTMCSHSIKRQFKREG